MRQRQPTTSPSQGLRWAIRLTARIEQVLAVGDLKISQALQSVGAAYVPPEGNGNTVMNNKGGKKGRGDRI